MVAPRTVWRAGVCLASLCVLALGTAACGGGGPREPTAAERSAIEANYEDYVQGFEDRDPKAICAAIAPSRVAAGVWRC